MPKEKEIGIENINLSIGGKTIPLTLEQAQELKTVLEKLFPAPVVVTQNRYVPYIPWSPPYRPWYDGPRWYSTMDKNTASMTLCVK